MIRNMTFFPKAMWGISPELSLRRIILSSCEKVGQKKGKSLWGVEEGSCWELLVWIWIEMVLSVLERRWWPKSEVRVKE